MKYNNNVSALMFNDHEMVRNQRVHACMLHYDITSYD